MFEDPKFWLLISFILFVILMYKPFNSMLIGGLDNKIEEIKKNINESLQSFTEAELNHCTNSIKIYKKTKRS